MEEWLINKKMSLSDLFFEIGNVIKNYEESSYVKEEIKVNDELYSINQIIELYPLLSKHILTNAINNGELKVTWLGNKRYFNLNDINEYLKLKQETVHNSVPETLESWRNR